MRLKSLEIKGFKSFADKTIVHFDEGVTGIIGPNGCGKSNIVDSIRWVIGEQKISALRSENLESLVFNGSKNRSASGLAEVSLTFENTRNLLPTEFSTVTVTRRYYKNGDSEYRLNDVQCRLKDIQRLFLDTGISTDSYAIIELGMVDEIIRDKDQSRRKMLEQAAGISIYKTRKREAKLKLDATELDLNRIEDLLFEINNQLKTLENQAKKAEKYYEIKKEYRKVSIELAKAALQGFNVEYRELNGQIDVESDAKLKIETEITTEEASVEEERLRFIEEEKLLQQRQQQFNQLVENVRQQEHGRNLAQQQSTFLAEKKTGLDEFLTKSEGEVAQLQKGVETTSDYLVEEELKLQDQQKIAQQLQLALQEKREEVDEKRQELNEYRITQQESQRRQFEAEKKMAVSDTGIANLQRSIAMLIEEESQRKTELADVALTIEKREQDKKDKELFLEDLKQQHERTKEQILSGQGKLEDLRSKLIEENRLYDKTRNEHDLLKSLIENMEGYPDSVKYLHKNPNWNHEVPILSDIIYVNEQYRAAVENVLEPYLNYFVVSDLEEGMQAVHLLEANQKGKANFFLLNEINAFVEGDIRKERTAHGLFLPGTIPAMEVIEVDTRYRNLAHHLLGNVFIAENDEALQNSTHHIILEKSGRYVKGKYFLSGGSVGLFEGKKIGRAKNLEKLQKDIQKIEGRIDHLKQQISRKHAEVIGFNEQLKEAAIRQTEQEIMQLTNALFAASNKRENLLKSQETGLAKLENQEIQLKETSAGLALIREDLATVTHELQHIEAGLQTRQEYYQLSEASYQEASAGFNQANLEATRQQNKVNSLRQELEYKKQQLHTLDLQIRESIAQLDTTNSLIEDNKIQLAGFQEKLVEFLKLKEEEEKQLNAADRDYYNHRNLLQNRESELRHKHKAKENLDTVLNAIKDKLNLLKLQLAGMKERLDVEFNIQIESLMDEERENEVPKEELQLAVDRMKKRLENLGEVNPTAIEAFEEMRKRYEFILEQKTDLVNAKEGLMRTIQEVEATANQQFLETFNKVRENFREVFQALFTEDDTADLILENPDNLAETGIDIVAKPKGKRPSSITQLSGGEKTLTATALLFAIYLIKPAPFCILDEVDAPLDDVNVGKFTQMIRKFSEKSQFIVVTHNKQTMGTVDVIYGVTMQEAGVSKLVPVDFRSLN